MQKGLELFLNKSNEVNSHSKKETDVIRKSLEHAQEEIIHPDDVDLSDIDAFAEKHGWTKEPVMSVSHSIYIY